MKVRTIKNWLILSLLIVYIVLYKFFIFQNYMKYSEFISTSFLAIVLTLSIILLGFRKDKVTILGKNVFKIVLVYIIIAFFVMYGIGSLSGYLKNTYPLNITNFLDNIIIPILIILLVEFIRYVFISANKDKKIDVILLTIILTVFELVITISTFDVFDIATTFNVTATMILPCILKNLLLSYFAYNVGYRIPIFYRLVVDMHLLVVPMIPNLGNYVNSTIFISLPILIYMSTFGIIDDARNRKEPVFNKKRFAVFDVPVSIAIVVLIASVSGFFPHYMIGIGSNSMKPTISKGDAVVLEKVNNKTNFKKGDIIAYSNGKITIVHRIKDIMINGEKKTYVMMGDANSGPDPRPVGRNQIKGIYKFKIPFIAWPTVWLTELFNS